MPDLASCELALARVREAIHAIQARRKKQPGSMAADVQNMLNTENRTASNTKKRRRPVESGTLEERITKRTCKSRHETPTEGLNYEKKAFEDHAVPARRDENKAANAWKPAERDLTSSNTSGFPQVPLSPPPTFGTASNRDPLPFNRLAMRATKDEPKSVPQFAEGPRSDSKESRQSDIHVAKARDSNFKIGPYVVYHGGQSDRIGVMRSESQPQSTDFDCLIEGTDEDSNQEKYPLKQRFDYISGELCFALLPSHNISSFQLRRNQNPAGNNTRGRPKAISSPRMESVLTQQPIKSEFKTRIDRCPER